MENDEKLPFEDSSLLDKNEVDTHSSKSNKVESYKHDRYIKKLFKTKKTLDSHTFKIHIYAP